MLMMVTLLFSRMRLLGAELTRSEKMESRMISLCPVSLSTGPGSESSVS